MEMTIKKRVYEELGTVWCGVSGEEVTEECVVPDTMPDVGAVLDAEGSVTLRGKEALTGCVQLSVSVSVWVLYAPEPAGALRSVELTLPAELRLDAPGVDEDCRPVARVRIRNLEARALNSRKLSLRAELEAEVRCYRRRALELPAGIEPEQKFVHVLERRIETTVVSDVREKTFVVTDDLSLPSGLSSVEGILSRRTEALVDDVKYVSGKAVFRGRVVSELLLTCGEGKLSPVRYETEFSQIMEIDGGEGEAQPQIVLMLTGVFYDLPEYGREADRIGAEIHVAAQCVCRQGREMAYMEDIYSNRTELIPRMDTVVLPAAVRRVSVRQTVAGRVEPAPPAGELIRAWASVGGVAAEGRSVKTAVSVRLLFREDNGAFVSARCRLPAEFTAAELSEESQLQNVCVAVSDIRCGAGGDVRAVLQMDAQAAEETAIRFVSEVEEADADQDRERAPSVTLVRVSEGTELWTLAKRYRSTEAGILAANEGRRQGLLLLPKER